MANTSTASRTPPASEVVVKSMTGEVLRIEPPILFTSTALSDEIARVRGIARQCVNTR